TADRRVFPRAGSGGTASPGAWRRARRFDSRGGLPVPLGGRRPPPAAVPFEGGQEFVDVVVVFRAGRRPQFGQFLGRPDWVRNAEHAFLQQFAEVRVAVLVKELRGVLDPPPQL